MWERLKVFFQGNFIGKIPTQDRWPLFRHVYLLEVVNSHQTATLLWVKNLLTRILPENFDSLLMLTHTPKGWALRPSRFLLPGSMSNSQELGHWAQSFLLGNEGKYESVLNVSHRVSMRWFGT